jgi:hypothetical protein
MRVNKSAKGLRSDQYPFSRRRRRQEDIASFLDKDNEEIDYDYDEDFEGSSDKANGGVEEERSDLEKKYFAQLSQRIFSKTTMSDSMRD